jgi:diketogulonate reductase-like aldo/keto reductase
MPYSANLPIADQIHASLKSSLHNLRADNTSAPYLDAVLLHSPLRSPTDTSTAWEALSSYVAAGKIRHVGIANCPLPILRYLNALDPPPAIVQNRFYAETAYEIPLRQLCKAEGIVFQSFWTLTGNPQLLRLEVVRELAERVGVEREVSLYAMVVGLGGISVLDGTTNEGRMEDDLDGLKIVEMWAGSEGKEEWSRLMKGFMEKIGEI